MYMIISRTDFYYAHLKEVYVNTGDFKNLNCAGDYGAYGEKMHILPFTNTSSLNVCQIFDGELRPEKYIQRSD